MGRYIVLVSRWLLIFLLHQNEI